MSDPRTFKVDRIPDEVTRVTDFEGQEWERAKSRPGLRRWQSGRRGWDLQECEEEEMIYNYGPVTEVPNA